MSTIQLSIEDKVLEIAKAEFGEAWFLEDLPDDIPEWARRDIKSDAVIIRYDLKQAELPGSWTFWSEAFDPLNDWSDIMPLVFKYKIDLKFNDSHIQVRCLNERVTGILGNDGDLSADEYRRIVVDCLYKIITE